MFQIADTRLCCQIGLKDIGLGHNAQKLIAIAVHYGNGLANKITSNLNSLHNRCIMV